jgi:hypothetical protein
VVRGIAWAAAPVPARVFACGQVFFNDLAQEVGAFFFWMMGGWRMCIHGWRL